RSNRRRVRNIVEPEIRTIEEIILMVYRSMEELLQAPTEGYGEAIVISEILAKNFEIKTNLFQLDDLVNKFVNQFFPPSKTTHLKNEISRFTQRFEETFGEAWDRFKEMLRACPHHGFSELTQIDTFCNGLHEQDHDSLNAVAGGNLSNKTTREALKIIENKSKVHYSRSKSNVSRVNTNSRDNVSKTDDRIDKLADQILNLVEIVNKQVITPATAKAVEETCVTCGGAHACYDCIATDSNQPSIYAATGSYNQVSPPNRASHQIPPPGFAPVQNNPNSYADALLLMPKFASTIKSLLANKDKLFELAKVPLNENCSAMLLKKLPEKLGDPDFEADPRVPLILGRSFLRTGRALIDVYGEEITLRVNDESITFNLNQNMRYSSTYDDNSVNRVDVIDIACKEFVQAVLDLQYNPKSSNPTLVSDPIISESDSCKEPIVKYSSPTLTLFGESDFFLEEIEYFLNDDSNPAGIENSVYDPKGDILFLEKLFNEDLFQLPPMDLKLAEESKAKSSVEEPLELELKELPSYLEYAFLEESNKLPVIIAKDLKDVEKEALINILKSHKRAIAWKISDIKGIDPRFCTHKILMEDDYKLAVQIQRRVNPKIHDVIQKEVIKLIDASMIYPISDSPWVSPIHCVPKKGGKTIFPLPFMDQMLDRLVGNEFYCFLDGFSGYFQIPIDPHDQEKTTFTCPYGTFAYRRMPFGLCNAPGTFQRDSFSSCLTNLDKMLERCEETNLVLNWEKCHFMCREGIVLGHKISRYGIEVDRAKVDVIAKLSHPTTVKGVRSFLEEAYRSSDFGCPRLEPTFRINVLCKRLAIGAILGQRKMKHFQPIHYASKTMTEAQIHYTTTEKEMFAVGIDFMGPFPSSKRNKYILVAVDYLSKWVEVKALPTNDARVVVKFLKSLFSRFGIPRAIISNRGTHFCNDQFTRVMIKYWVTHILATAYHPRTSCQVEVSNRGLKRILERTVGENRASWLDKLDDALWAFRTAFKTPIGCTPYNLVYGKSCHLPIELEHRAYWALKHVNFDLKTASDHRKLQLNELSDLHDQAYENSVIYKERTKKLHDSKIKNRIFNVGFSYGTIELSQPNGPNFKVNVHCVKHYFGGDIPSNVVPDLHTFPMDK
nr:DNA-directed DNA polymerase [Tanacetum cinerariifolium]